MILVKYLILNMNYKHDNRYQLTDQGLLFVLDVHFKDAIDGNEIEYKHIDDKILKIKIPDKSNNNDIIRLNNKGFLIDKNNRMPLIMKLNIIIDYARI